MPDISGRKPTVKDPPTNVTDNPFKLAETLNITGINATKGEPRKRAKVCPDLRIETDVAYDRNPHVIKKNFSNNAIKNPEDEEKCVHHYKLLLKLMSQPTSQAPPADQAWNFGFWERDVDMNVPTLSRVPIPSSIDNRPKVCQRSF